MPKPLFRWTCGAVSDQGIDILIESVKRTTFCLELDRFDWMICYNGLSDNQLDKLQAEVKGYPITFFNQNWAECPIEDECSSPKREDGSCEWNGSRCGGTLWKVCPPRMRMESHEIIMDNDVVLLKKFPQIDEFLNTLGKALVLEEPIRFYGRYSHLLPLTPPYINSGFMGLPPRYDFGKEIRRIWENNNSLKKISQADEQGLLMATLYQVPNIRISSNQMKEVLAKDYSVKITGNEEGIHFTQSNRIPNHQAWLKYKNL